MCAAAAAVGTCSGAEAPTVHTVSDRSTGVVAECRRLLVGMGVNEPVPFPGYSGFVGWETPCVLESREQIVSFSAGYWHASLPSPVDFAPETRVSWAKGGCPMEIEAPRGGRAMLIRSGDGGLTWSRPETIIDTARDDRHPALCELDNGVVLCLLFGIDGWYGYPEPPPGRGRNSIAGVIRSLDGGKTFEQTLRLFPSPFKYYDRMCAGLLKASDGSVLAPTYGMDTVGGLCRGAVYRSDDDGATWRLLAVVDSENGIDEPAIAEVAPGRLVLIARNEGDLAFSADMGQTWTTPVSLGIRMYAPKLLTLRDGTLLCVFGSYSKTKHGFQAIWSRDGGHTWTAPAADHGFVIDSSVYGYGAAVELDDGSIWCVYYDTGRQHQTRTGTWSVRFRIRDSGDGIDILPVPGAGAATPAPSATPQTDDLPYDADAM